MEYVGGTKINDVADLEQRGVDRSQVAENLQLAYMQMIIDDGVFHADPHPGNLAVTDDGRGDGLAPSPTTPYRFEQINQR